MRRKGFHMDRPNDVFVVDSHQHFWDPHELNLPPVLAREQVLNRAYMPEDLAEEIKRVGVDYTVLVQGLPQEMAINDWYFRESSNCDFIAGVVAWVNLLEPAGIAASLDKLQREPKFVGIRHVVELEPDVEWMLQAPVIESFREIARRGIPFDMCVHPKHLPNVLRVLDRVNDLSVVIDHIAKPAIARGGSPGWELNMAKIADSPQVYCKLSGMITEADRARWKPSDLAPYVHTVIDIFGYHRVMFGSDWPVCRLAGEYEQVWSALNEILIGVTKEKYRRVFGTNAIEFYDLDVGSQ